MSQVWLKAAQKYVHVQTYVSNSLGNILSRSAYVAWKTIVQNFVFLSLSVWVGVIFFYIFLFYLYGEKIWKGVFPSHI